MALCEDDEEDMGYQDEAKFDHELYANDPLFASIYDSLSGPHLPVFHIEPEEEHSDACITVEEGDSVGGLQLDSSAH